ncbi:hypothetical protein [Zobellia sp. 1_MG-2023]|uniref:hypothetical protein n=1 Tax=Zobellia sp. 1_MG-2023 TaxID=3062626 RepID=UPI0026E18E47|nr:hypothetical protein [Zobellia sp. 1_MG-2023]MDO6818090.1 hypothetical protein [Zobellia sp. 1_MG-2023]
MPFVIDLPPQSTELPKTRVELFNRDKESRNINDFQLSDDLVHLDDDLVRNVFLMDRFESLVHSWEKNTIFSSSMTGIIEDHNFQEILKMGKDAIPLIINEINKKPSQLVWALNIITDSSLKTRQRLTLTEACKRWVKLFNSGKIPLN